jgi:pilus assembly protein Flp/PilA
MFVGICRAIGEKNMIKNFLKEDSGVTAIEYALIASLIAMVIVASVTLIGTSLSPTFNTVASQL